MFLKVITTTIFFDSNFISHYLATSRNVPKAGMGIGSGIPGLGTGLPGLET